LTADAQSRVYGDANPALTYQIGGRGLANGDVLTGGLATAADTRSSVGAYGIGQGSLAASRNYAVSYVGSDLAVTARPLTLTADAQSRVHGEANPTLTYQVGGRGLVNGDSLTGALATTAATGSSAGTYTINQGSLTVTPNYTLTYIPADLTVTPAPAAAQPSTAAITPTVASTVERSAFTPDGSSTAMARIVGTPIQSGTASVADPRFDKTVVCLTGAGGCFVVAPAGLLTQPPGATNGPRAEAALPTP
ncbi:hypothetical protein SAMN02799631_00711, partial [Methylobacterium sp. 174MFSha1.1]|uniref:MBG-2 domain-containing protein n=1 Tax=Methylobacterium sp. 174MFSha1.1 TaxID=1502749 RepID=UPI0008EC5F42